MAVSSGAGTSGAPGADVAATGASLWQRELSFPARWVGVHADTILAGGPA